MTRRERREAQGRGSAARRIFWQFVRFLLVGGVSFAVDFGLYLLLYAVFGVQYVVASTISFSLSLVLNYILTLKFVFEARAGRNHAKEFAMYVGLNIIALGLNQGILFLTVDLLGASPVVGKIVATAVVLVYNFISRKLLIERSGAARSARDAAPAPPARNVGSRRWYRMTDNELAPARPGTRLGGAIDRGWSAVERAWARFSNLIATTTLGLWFKRVERPAVADWAILGAIALVAFSTFLYGDVKATFEHSFNFLDSVFAGRPQDFYQIAIENASYGHPAVYDVPIYLIFGLWNLPTYALYRFADFNYLGSTPALLWLKLMLVLFALVSAWLVLKIAKKLGMTTARAKWAAFYFLSSMALFVPVFVIVQYDIIAVTFMLAGILAYLNGRTRSFLLWFLAANTLKLFGLFIFIPLVLLREKRLVRAFGQIVVGVLGLLLCRLLYRGDVAFEASTGGFTDLMLDRLRTAGFTWQSSIPVPLFVVFIVGLAIFAYAKRTTTERELQAFTLYISLAAFLVFCAIVPLNPYWIALVAPFSVLIIFANPRHLTLNTFLEIAIGTSILLIYMLVGYSMYNAGIFTDLLFGQFIPPADPQRFGTPGAILAAVGLAGNNVIFLVGFMIACVLAVLIINYPRASFIAAMPNTEPIKRSVVWVRLAALVGFCGLLFAMYLLPAKPVAYDSTTATPVNTLTDVLAPGSTVEQELLFDRPIEVDSLQIGVDASEITWIDSAVLVATIEDESGSVVYEGRTPANAIGVGLVTFETKGLVFEADRVYTLRLVGVDYEGEPAFVQLNPDLDSFVTTADGVVVAGDLVMVVNGTVGAAAEAAAVR